MILLLWERGIYIAWAKTCRSTWWHRCSLLTAGSYTSSHAMPVSFKSCLIKLTSFVIILSSFMFDLLPIIDWLDNGFCTDTCLDYFSSFSSILISYISVSHFDLSSYDKLYFLNLWCATSNFFFFSTHVHQQPLGNNYDRISMAAIVNKLQSPDSNDIVNKLHDVV